MERVQENLTIAALIFMCQAILIPAFGQPAILMSLALSAILIWNSIGAIKNLLGSLRR
jgi:hypothetical protein